MKRCCRCDVEKDRSEFYSDSRKRDGLRSHCKTCHNDESKRWARANREKRRATHRRWRVKYPERARTAMRSWVERNPGYMNDWRRANPEQAKAAAARFRRAHPEYVRRRNRINHDQRRGARPTPAALDYAEIIRCDPCSYCEADGGTVDHIVPAARGGDGEWDNLTGACANCNGRKSAKPLLTFMLEAA